MYSSSAREANQNNTISGLFQKLRKSELQKKLKVPHQLLDNRQNNPTDAMLLAELGNEASGSNNKGKEMTGEMVGQRQENPTTPHKKKDAPQPNHFQLPDAPTKCRWNSNPSGKNRH